MMKRKFYPSDLALEQERTRAVGFGRWRYANELRKLVLATLVQSDMRLAPRRYMAGWSHVFRDTKWRIEPT